MSATPDKLPPHSPEAEAGLLGCIVEDAKRVMPEIRSIVEPEMFFMFSNQMIWNSVCELFDAGKLCDITTLAIWLKNASCFQDLPKAAEYLGLLRDATVSPSNWPDYLEIVQKTYILRKIIQHSQEAIAAAYVDRADAEEVLARFESKSLAIRQGSTAAAEFLDFRTVQEQVLNEYEQAMDGKRPGLRTGFRDVDRILGCLREQQFILLAGTPSAGKTSLVLNIAKNAAAASIKTGFISQETSGKKIVHRLNCISSGANGHRLLNGRPTQGDMDAIMRSTKGMAIIKEHILIYDRGLNAPQCVSIMRRMYAKGARLFIVDYLQLLDAGQKTNNGNERITIVSRILKAAAKELESPIIAISSLNRESSKQNRAPQRSDLRESGQLEFDADVIMLLHAADDGPETRTVEVNVDKNKDGETGKTTLTFFPPCMKFKDSAIGDYAQ